MRQLVEALGFELKRISGSHHIPDLEACSAFGRTPEEAVAEVERAKEAWLRSARDEEKPIPEPRYKPAVH
jgi:predicted RNase H-like HicB family nuclease